MKRYFLLLFVLPRLFADTVEATAANTWTFDTSGNYGSTSFSMNVDLTPIPSGAAVTAATLYITSNVVIGNSGTYASFSGCNPNLGSTSRYTGTFLAYGCSLGVGNGIAADYTDQFTLDAAGAGFSSIADGTTITDPMFNISPSDIPAGGTYSVEIDNEVIASFVGWDDCGICYQDPQLQPPPAGISVNGQVSATLDVTYDAPESATFAMMGAALVCVAAFIKARRSHPRIDV